ncbi:MAG: TonB-dependent receptor [Caulobacteraceae bacterium]|nr:TonB-dependent receptor [Caulobacteraceae bacterium]
MIAALLAWLAPWAADARAAPRAVAHFNIPAEPLSSALNQLAVQSNHEILFSPALTAGRPSDGLRGDYSVEEALGRLLAGTGLVFHLQGTSILIEAARRAAPSPSASKPEQMTPSDVGTIMVTALKRPTLAQETPISMTVVRAETLERRVSADLDRIAAQLPGLQVAHSSFGRRLVVRGVYGYGEATTGLYYDDTPVTGPVGTTADPGMMVPELAMVDVARIELLRGPQGTLYGAGSMGGTLRILFRKPDLDASALTVSGGVTAATHGGLTGDFAATLNQPLVDDRLGVRVVVYDHGAPGVTDNIRLGIKDVDTSRETGGRLSILWEPDQRISLRISGAAQTTRQDDMSTWRENVGPWRTQHAVRAPFDGDITLINGVLAWKSDVATVTATSSWYQWRMTRRWDYSNVLDGAKNSATGCARYFSFGDGVACNADQLSTYNGYVAGLYPATLNQPGHVRAWINEVRAASPDKGPWRWTVGAYSEQRGDGIDSQVLQVNPATGLSYDPARFIGRRSIDNDLRQAALFGETSYAPRVGTDITLGARWFDYRKRDQGLVQIPNVISGTSADFHTDAATREQGWSFKLLADQRLGRNAMAYAQLSQGFRPGGVNVVPGLPDKLAPYRSDRLTNYEIGLKSEWIDRRLTANFAIYQIDWRDMQYSATTQNGAFSFLANIGASRIRGLEAEFALRGLAGWDATLSATYTDARLTADQTANAAIGLGRKGDRLPMVPHFTTAGSLERQWSLPGGLDLLARLDASYVGASWSGFTSAASDNIQMGGYALFGATLALNLRTWRANLVVDNLLDRAGKAQTTSGSGPIDVFGVQPRTLRLSLTKSF